MKATASTDEWLVANCDKLSPLLRRMTALTNIGKLVEAGRPIPAIRHFPWVSKHVGWKDPTRDAKPFQNNNGTSMFQAGSSLCLHEDMVDRIW